MPNRYPYDLSHQHHATGAIGRVRNLLCMPVEAGASIALNLQALFRLSPLRRQLVMDAKITLAAFAVPMRHIYGDLWLRFIQEGQNETVTFPTATIASQDAGGRDAYGLGIGVGGAYGPHVPLWIPASYNRIWNRYWRFPTADEDILADNYMLAKGDENRYGYHCGRLPTPWSRAVDTATAPTDVAVQSNEFDIRELAQAQAEYGRFQTEKYYGQRYHDIMKRLWGGYTTPDGDERPIMLAKEDLWMSGHDVDGTDETTIGSYTGKAYTQCGIGFPMRFFPEHAVLVVQATVRFPPVLRAEYPTLAGKSQPTYLELAGDPRILRNEPPAQISVRDYLTDAVVVSEPGERPYGDHYRYWPSIVADDFHKLEGYPFSATSVFNLGTTQQRRRALRYHGQGGENFDVVFKSAGQLKHWQAHANVGVTKISPVPDPTASIYAGAD